MKLLHALHVSPRRVSRVPASHDVWPASLTLLAQSHQLRRVS